MVSREIKEATLHENLQLLRSVTNSKATSNESIVIDASKYIEELKEKVEKLKQDIMDEQQSHVQDSLRSKDVKVKTHEKGFLITVVGEKSFPGLLVSILEAFEELGLNVTEARVSCAGAFRLEVVGGEEITENVDEHVVEQAVLQAIKKCSDQNNE